MFNGANQFNINIDDWAVNLITNMSDMFNGASNFDQWEFNRGILKVIKLILIKCY